VLEKIDEAQKKDDIDVATQILSEVYSKTNKHYRVFFEDELEHD